MVDLQPGFVREDCACLMKYRHRKSGAEVEVRDDKVLDPQEWEKVPARKAAPRKSPASTDDE